MLLIIKKIGVVPRRVSMRCLSNRSIMELLNVGDCALKTGEYVLMSLMSWMNAGLRMMMGWNRLNLVNRVRLML